MVLHPNTDQSAQSSSTIDTLLSVKHLSARYSKMLGRWV